MEEMKITPAPAVTDGVDSIENDLNDAESGSADLQREVDSLGSEIEKGL